MDLVDGLGSHSILFDDSLDAKNNESLLDFDDFPLEEEEEQKEDYFPGAEEGNDEGANPAWVKMLNLPPAAGVPVGGLRRVSSCYFSIASNLSAGDYHSTSAMLENSSFYSSPNPSHHNSVHHYDALSFEGRNASDFLLHDLLMNIFTFLDAQSLASFSETARRPNFECFYFLELQLQRALLVGDSHQIEGDDEGEEESGRGGDRGDAGAVDAVHENVAGIEIGDVIRDALLADPAQQAEGEHAHNEGESPDEEEDSSKGEKAKWNSAIPSFEGSIAGTGVISRLAFLDSASARRIVQAYLDSNASIRSMPLLHSLAYLRQVLMRGAANPSLRIPHPTAPNIPENVAKGARNMALIFTFLGAAYVHAQQGGDMPAVPMPAMPDPSEMLNEENVEALKNVMLKLGLAGGVFEAGKRVKEKVVEQAAAASKSAGSDPEEAGAQVVGSSSAGDDDTAIGDPSSTNNDAVSSTDDGDAAPNPSPPIPYSMAPHIPENVAKNARNMALVFTFLGAAYVHTQQGGDMPAVPMPAMPDPSEMLNEENVEVLKNVMLKLGLAKGVFEAGKRVKEVAEQAAAANRSAGSKPEEAGAGVVGSSSQGDDDAANSDPSSTNDDVVSSTGDAGAATVRKKSNPRSSSIGSLEDFSNMMPRPSAIASRLYSAFSSSSNNNANSATVTTTYSPKTSTADLGATAEEENESSHNDKQKLDTLHRKKVHRSKRSHKPLRQDTDGVIDEYTVGELGGRYGTEELCDGWTSSEEMGSFNPEEPAEEQKTDCPPMSSEEMAYAMDHPLSHNPYDHPLSNTFNSAATSKLSAEAGSKDLSSGDPPAPREYAASFFSFGMNYEVSAMTAGNKPTGCIGAYARAVHAAASEVTRLVKAERRRNFDALPADRQHELSVQFIEACTSDDTLGTVKEILQRNREMDVDRFFVGPDDTETCALHAAAFNGAERVLEFLCGGIDERRPGDDCGMCDVNVRDANGWTALHFAAGANSVTSVRVLSSHGAELAVEAGNGYTPYHWAERLSNEEAKDELGRLGADSRFVGGWMFGGAGRGLLDPAGGGDGRRIPFVSFLANQFFAFSGR